MTIESQVIDVNMFMTFNKEVWTGELLKQPSGWEGLECYMKSIISSFTDSNFVKLKAIIAKRYGLMRQILIYVTLH